MVTLVSTDISVEQTDHAGAQYVLFNISLKVPAGIHWQTLVPEECEHAFILIHMGVESIVCVNGAFQAKGFPYQIRDHPTGLPGILGTASSVFGEIESVLSVVVVGVFRRQPSEKDGS